MGMWKTGGGGFLHNEDATIVGYKFDTKEWESKGKGKDGYSTLSVELLVKRDNVDEPVKQFLPAGFFYPETQSISKDGLTIEQDGDGAAIQKSPFTAFIDSLIASGFDGSRFPENGRNFEAMVGTRVTFVKAIDTEAQMAAGKKKLGAKANDSTEEGRKAIMDAGRRVDPKDKKKSYNRDMLLVSAVLGSVEVKGGKGKGTTKAAPKAEPKAEKTAAAPKASDLTKQADGLLVDFLANNKGKPLPKAKLGNLVIRASVDQDAPIDKKTREALIELMESDEYLNAAAERGVIAYDSDSADQTISLAD
jgi:hypothetical protein